jgi:ABC-type branched-subunit amino acid transport system ATPase component
LREIKIYAAEVGVLEKFAKINKEAALGAMREMYIRQLPRFYLEAAAIGGLLIYIGSSVAFSFPGDQIVAILGIFGIALLRLLPSVNRIVVCSQNIRYALPSLENLTQILIDIDDEKVGKKSVIRFMESIELIDVVFNYPGGNSSALGPISLKIARGDSIAIIGKSGSGKTTLLNVILGLLAPTSGSILIDGIRVSQYMLDPKKIGYVAQHSFITNDSLLENIAFHRDINPAFLENSVSVAQLGNVMRQKADTPIGEDGNGLSGGERQRLAIARALAAKPEILILDEFSSALDNETEKAVIDSIESAGDINITKIIVTHKLDSSFKCNKIIRLSRGMIIN